MRGAPLVFTPRRADSRWSAINRKRYAQLKASGRLKPAGIERAPTARSAGQRPPRFQLPAALPRYVQTALKRHPAAGRCFEGLAPSQRRRYVGWIESAKRDETKARRLEEALASWLQASRSGSNRTLPSLAAADLGLEPLRGAAALLAGACRHGIG